MNGEMYSMKLRVEEKMRQKRDKIRRLHRLSVKLIVTRYIRDNIKAPLGNHGFSAFLARSSFDIYFGEDIQALGDGSIVMRTAYGNGSGSSTIGHDPRHARICEIFPELRTLMIMVGEVCADHYSKIGIQMNTQFNHVAVKLYFNDKDTREHSDIEFDAKHNPTRNNSQVPGTPVVILTLGDEKILKMRRWDMQQDGTKVASDRIINIRQKSGSMFVLDPRDEFLSNGGRHFWKHGSHMVKPTGVCISLMFRVVQGRREVYKESGEFVDKRVAGTGAKERQFDKGWRELERNKVEYDKKMKEAEATVISRLSEFWDK